MENVFSDLKADQQLVRSVWPEWELTEFLGSGQFGVVYSARKKSLVGNSVAAIKIVTIRYDLYETENKGRSKDSYLQSLTQSCVREVQMMESVKGYSNIVNIEDYTVVQNTGGNPWYVLIRMELLTTLFEYMDTHALGEEDIVRLGTDLCRALEVCKARQIVHRDIKPANVFVNDDGVFKLGDFGVARQIMDCTFQTRTGTPEYMAPEIYNGSMSATDFESAHRADVYSVGMLLYWIANGKRQAFVKKEGLVSSKEISAAFKKRMNGDPLPPPEKVSQRLQNIILKACAFQPSDRYKSATQFREALEKKSSYAKTERSGVRPVWIILCLIALVITAGLAVTSFLRDTTQETKTRSGTEVSGTTDWVYTYDDPEVFGFQIKGSDLSNRGYELFRAAETWAGGNVPQTLSEFPLIPADLVKLERESTALLPSLSHEGTKAIWFSETEKMYAGYYGRITYDACYGSKKSTGEAVKFERSQGYTYVSTEGTDASDVDDVRQERRWTVGDWEYAFLMDFHMSDDPYGDRMVAIRMHNLPESGKSVSWKIYSQRHEQIQIRVDLSDNLSYDLLYDLRTGELLQSR